MQRGKEIELSSSNERRSKTKKLKNRNEIFQQCDNKLADTFGLQEDINKHKMNNIKMQEIKKELSNRKLTNQLFFCKCKLI